MSIAWAALILWPVVCIVLFKQQKLPVAVCVGLIGGNLLLPSGVSKDLPLLPPLDKHSIPVLTVLALTAITLRDPHKSPPVLPGWLPRHPAMRGLMALMVVSAFGTAVFNRDMLIYGPKVLPGLRIYDAFSMLLAMLILTVPLVLGRKVLSTPEAQRTFLKVLVVSGVVYCFPALWEARMSPQLHATVYGFYPHSWFQALRGGGYRPSVFMGHGLELAIFLAMTIVAAVGLFRVSSDTNRAQWLIMAGFLMVVLVLCNSLGALMIAAVMAPIALLCKPRTQLLVAAGVCGVLLLYPMMRVSGLIPVGSIVSFADSIDPLRAASLNFRLSNEDILLEKARQRPLFGWGMWARNRVYNEAGLDISITDGFWVIFFGIGGWVRYVAICGFLCLPTILLYFYRRSSLDPVCVAIAMVLATKLVDLIPNAGLEPLIWLMVGSLMGRLEMRAEATEESPQAASDDHLRPRGSRAPPVSVGYRRKFDTTRKTKKPAAPVRDLQPSYIRTRSGAGYRK